MSTPQTIALRARTGLSTALVALGVLIAVAVTVVLLVLTGSSRVGSASPARAAYQSAQNRTRCVYVRQEHACVRQP